MAWSKAIFTSLLARAPSARKLLNGSARSLLDSPSAFAIGKRPLSTNASSVLELMLSNSWSAELETELDNLIPLPNHEIAIYVLKKLNDDPEKASEFFSWMCRKDGFKQSSALYSLMLRVLVTKGRLQEFWVTLRRMKDRGFFLDEETYMTILGILKKEKRNQDAMALTHFYSRMIQENAQDTMVKQVIAAILEKEWTSEVERGFQEMKLELSDNFVIRVLKELRNHPLKVLKFFHWVGSCSGFAHSTVTYNAAARVLARDDSIEEFWSIIEEMKGLNYDLDADTYTKIMRQFQKSNMMHDAVKLYEFMMDGLYQPSVQECSLLLRSLAGKAADTELAFRVLRKFESTGQSLPKVIYDGVLRCITAVGKLDLAEDMMESMRNSGHTPDNVTYSQFVFGLCKVGRLDEACNLLEKMEEEGCTPDIKTWTILMQGHCDANDVDKAFLIFAKMLEKNVDVDADVLDVLVNGFISQDKVEGAYKLLTEIVHKFHVQPWQATYKHLINKLLAARKLEEAMDLLREMKRKNYPPFSEPFVEYISKFGTVNDAAEFLKALSFKEYPAVQTFFNILQYFFKEGRNSEAKDILYQCPPHIRGHPKINELFGSTKSPKVAY
ncbi:hypothetical protein SAY86_015014 [Trapa natans]|uniref:Pentatricopeptide repeat-containing protein n=1 Tax=Trapa natans TaxID=22666 RepID=A0AAN7KL77_TRANT|nr:hypothetical protein SAY86_015014 [Trapa natans]